MTTVLVVEDQQVLASALEMAIGAQPDLDCLGAAATIDDAMVQLDSREPDVVLMDIELPGTDGVEGTRLIKAAHPQVTVLVLTGRATQERLDAAAAAGAGGFLAKDTPFGDVLAAIRNPLRGKVLIEGQVPHDLLSARPAQAAPAAGGPATSQPAGTGGAGLTAREHEVLALMGQGLDPAAIATRLVLSIYTARGHVKNVMTKLGAHTQLEAVVIATRHGLIATQGGAEPQPPQGQEPEEP